MRTVRIALNPHWYSQFWIGQFWQLWQAGEIKLRPTLNKTNPYASFYFEVDGHPCLIDVHDKKELWLDPADYTVYFKANFSPRSTYPANVVPSLNGTTLKRVNVPPPESVPRPFDIVCISSVTGGFHHKIALFEALAALPVRHKLVLKLASPEQVARFATRLQRQGIEVVTKTIPYRQWLAWNKQGRWCVLTRGKHDCLSFKMLDYCSIGAAVVADYTPTSTWPHPLRAGEHFLDLGLPAFTGDEMVQPDLEALCVLYRRRVAATLPELRDESLRRRISRHNQDYFNQHVANGAAARHVLRVVESYLTRPAYETVRYTEAPAVPTSAS